MKKIFLSVLLFLSSYHAGISQANTFDLLTNILTMDSVIVNGLEYPNVVVRIDQFSVLGVGSSAPDESKISETCTETNITKDKFDKIQIGMSINQVTQIIGCQVSYSDFGSFSWRSDGQGTQLYSHIYVVADLKEGNYFINGYSSDGQPVKGESNLSNIPSLISGTSIFDPTTNVLTMDSVSVTGHLKYENVVISVSQFTMLGVGGSTIRPAPPSPPPPSPPPPSPPVNTGSCGLDRFTTANYNAIQPGMSLDEVTQIMGCQFTPIMTQRVGGIVSHSWTNFDVTQMFILVVFDESTMRVNNFDPYKYWQGRSFVNQ